MVQGAKGKRGLGRIEISAILGELTPLFSGEPLEFRDTGYTTLFSHFTSDGDLYFYLDPQYLAKHMPWIVNLVHGFQQDPF